MQNVSLLELRFIMKISKTYEKMAKIVGIKTNLIFDFDIL